ncbi:Stigma-specific Stig1 family protein [Quillaja saponaria]|uniref:Stigma-specific Stig1 family protein n=1 Tax=Quillaja saponaria TaxID=32244 RepID=A0AAD7QJ54_QUISA|nr:Stigma-specific Stig1 family protein [Quillaja saponaria]
MIMSKTRKKSMSLTIFHFRHHFRSSRSRFLTSIIKKGTQCDQKARNICNGVSANKGTSLLFCCKTHCRNVLGDRNNCGRCGQKCGHGERCCGGVCTKILHNVNHCGKCNKKCSAGVGCENGFCGYA